MKSTAAALAMAGLVSAKVAFTNTAYNGISAGQPFNLTWGGADDKACDIILKSGPSTNLVKVDTLATGSTNSYFVWSPSSSLSSCEQYAFEIVQGDDTNYSPQFSIAGLGPCVSSTTSSTSATSTSSHSKSSTDSSSTSSGSESSTITSSTYASITNGPLLNTTTTSGTTLSVTAKQTSTAPGSQTTTPISNTNAGQRMSYSPLVLALAGAAGLLCL